MTPTLLLDKIEENGSATPKKSVEADPQEPVNLKEDTTLRRAGSLAQGGPIPRSNFFSEAGAGRAPEGAVSILFSEEPPATESRSPLRASLKVLVELRSRTEAVDWLEAAVVLKRDVVRLRDTNFSRHAAVLLAMADALAFTEPAELLSDEGVKPLLDHALGLLSEPYISEATEEEFLGNLLMSGWNLVPSQEQTEDLVG